jgi:6-phosphofructokinase 1
LRYDFASGKRLGLIIRSEYADATYTTQFVTDLLEKEGGELFDVRAAILGHVQQGGSPSPFDRIQSTRLADLAVRHLLEQVEVDEPTSAMLGIVRGRPTFMDLRAYPALIEPDAQRPLSQPWLALRDLASVMSGRGGDAPLV